MIGTELSIEYSAFESVLDRFINLEKGDFLGKQALLERQSAGLKSQLVTLVVKDVVDADALGNNALTWEGQLVGRATSGGFGFRVNQSLAMGMVEPAYARLGTEMTIEILGKLYPAVVVGESPYDPENLRPRHNQ